MKVSAFLSLLVVTAIASVGCGQNDAGTLAGPSRMWQVDVRCPQFGESARCTAFATDGQDMRDVTGLAEWSTGDPGIATASSTGSITINRTGEVAIRASYQGATGFAAVWAVPDHGLHGTYRTLEGTVVGLSGPLADVSMEILTGPNAGRRMTTSSIGSFYMDGLQDGQFTIRLSKPGYVTAEYTWWIPGGKERTPTLSASR